VEGRPEVSESIRCFLAVEIPEAVRLAAADLLEKLRKGVQFTKAYPSWVKPENQHFTVVFLGHKTAEEVERIKSVLADLPEAVAPFGVSVAGLGVFPNPKFPRVLWLGVQRGMEEFGRLYEATIKRLVTVGFEPESRPYHPHLTLARIKSTRGVAEMMDVVKSHQNAQCGEFTAEGLTLFQSRLHPQGAIYTPLEHWKFF
jgi:2'-5' RNA ligase